MSVGEAVGLGGDRCPGDAAIAERRWSACPSRVVVVRIPPGSSEIRPAVFELPIRPRCDTGEILECAGDPYGKRVDRSARLAGIGAVDRIVDVTAIVGNQQFESRAIEPPCWLNVGGSTSG